jgi:RNA polymerase sigma factor (sigma-70 family)
MTELLSEIEAPSDAELISRVRGGDVAAYGDLFSRHVSAANRLARQLVRGPDADDLVSESFAKVLHVLQGGGGPDVAFRAYLLTAVRRLHVDRIRSNSKLQTTDDMTQFDPGVPFQDTAVAGFESGAAAKAFASLPERWQLVLWHLEVEGQKPADIAPLLGMSANSVSALAYRAREGLRQAFLTMHLSDISETECRWVNDHLGAYVRKGLSKRDTTKVESHLDECRRCTAMYLELTEVNSNLAGIIAPLLLGAAATGYLSSTGVGGAGVVISLLSRAKDVVLANTGAASAGAIAVGVAAVAVVGITLTQGHHGAVIGADAPVAVTSVAPSGPPTDGATSLGTSKAPAGASTGSSSGPSTAPSAGLSTGPSAGQGNVLIVVPSAGLSTGPGATGLVPGGLVATTGPGGVPGQPDQPAQPGQPATQHAPGTSPSAPHPSASQPPTPSHSPSTPPPPATEPPPTQTEPPTTSTPPGPVVVDTNVGVTSAAYNSTTASVDFSISGNPTLPPTFQISLTPADSGISFGIDGACAPTQNGELTLSNSTEATCDTTKSVVQRPFLRAVPNAVGGATFTGSMPLVIPANQPKTAMTFIVTLPSGFKNTSDKASAAIDYVPPVLTDVDVSFTDLVPDPAATGANGRYELTGHLGLPGDDTGDITFTLSGAATFVDTPTSGCAVSADPRTPLGKTITCTDAKSGPVHFVLAADDSTTDTWVSITASALSGYTDNDTTHNTADATLTRGATTNNLVMSGQLSSYDKMAKTADLSVTVAGAPSGMLTFKLASTANVVLSAGSQCTVNEGVVCEFDGNGPFTTTLKLTALPSGLSEKLTLSVTANNNTDNGNQNTIKIAPPSDDFTGLVSGVIDSLTGLLGQ